MSLITVNGKAATVNGTPVNGTPIHCTTTRLQLAKFSRNFMSVVALLGDGSNKIILCNDTGAASTSTFVLLGWESMLQQGQHSISSILTILARGCARKTWCRCWAWSTSCTCARCWSPGGSLRCCRSRRWRSRKRWRWRSVAVHLQQQLQQEQQLTHLHQQVHPLSLIVFQK